VAIRKVPVRRKRAATATDAPRSGRLSQTVLSERTERSERRATGRRPATPIPEDQEISAARARIPDAVPAGWLDRLLAALLDLPLDQGERAVVDAVLAALGAIVPGYAFGACVAAEPGAWAEQLVVKVLPEGVAEAPAGVDPARLFPWLAHEHVASLPGSRGGSTLHVASNEDPLGQDSSVLHLTDRGAAVLWRALELARRPIAARRAADAGSFEERMIQADKLAAFGQIAAGVVHELNNPLTSIVAYSDYLLRSAVARGPAVTPDEADDVERLRRINESANRMLRLTRDLVSYARPSSGITGPVPLHSVIDQAVAFCEHVLAGASVRVDRRFGADVLSVRGVSEHLVQVFVNLLTNASQAATEHGGTVTITTAVDPAGRRVRVVLEDDGKGILPEHLPLVFDPFFTTKGDRHGTGLGLSIVKSIVEAHDGVITADSEPSRGARFVIELTAWPRR
jgi:signal transduction histidine kinase